MRKLCSFLLAAFLFAASSVTAYAQADVSYAENSAGVYDDAVVLGEDDREEQPAVISSPADSPPPAASSGIYPLNVETVTENGVVLVKKTYELPVGVDPASLSEGFERDGYSFTLRDILQSEQQGGDESRPAVKTAMALTDSDDEAEILAQFPVTINHEEDGFSGRLTLDVSSLVTEPEEYETYTYAYTETEELGPLGRNDPALLEKERQGMTMAGIEFEGRTEEQVGDSLVPSTYAATAIWQGTATGQRPVSYRTTATYSGVLTKTGSGSVLYTYIYSGALIPQPEPTAQPEASAVADAAEEEAATEAPTEQIAAPAPVKSSPFALSDDTVAWLIPLVVVILLLLALLLQNHRNSKKERIIRRQNREAIEEIRRFIYGDAERLA